MITAGYDSLKEASILNTQILIITVGYDSLKEASIENSLNSTLFY